MSKLDESYEIIGRVLAKLILAGLRRQEVEGKDVLAVLTVEADYHFNDVMSWLHSESLITSQGTIVGGGYYGVQLTSKGLAAIENGRFDGSQHKTIRDTVESEPAGSLGSDLYGKIGSFVGGFFGGFTQSMQ